MQEVDKIQDKIKFTSKGNPRGQKKTLLLLMMVRQVRLEEQIAKMTSSKEGQYGKAFKIQEIGNGPKQKLQEAQVVKHGTARRALYRNN